LSVSRPAGRALWGSAPRKGWPRRRFLPGNGDWGGPSVKPGGGRRSKPWFPCRSSVVQRLTREDWKSSGPAASCCESRAVTRRRSAQWWLLSRRPHQHEGHVHADIALVPASVCENRSHRYAKVVRGAGWSGGARTEPAGGIWRPVPLLQPARRSREGTLVCGRWPSGAPS